MTVPAEDEDDLRNLIDDYNESIDSIIDTFHSALEESRREERRAQQESERIERLARRKGSVEDATILAVAGNLQSSNIMFDA